MISDGLARTRHEIILELQTNLKLKFLEENKAISDYSRETYEGGFETSPEVRSAGVSISTCGVKSCPADYWETLHSKFAAQWSVEDTGRYVLGLKTDFLAHDQTEEAFQQLAAGVKHAMLHCPESNKPWLLKFLLLAKSTISAVS